jgi:hypothetical protein
MCRMSAALAASSMRPEASRASGGTAIGERTK